MRGYYPGEREYRDRPSSRPPRPRVAEPAALPATPPAEVPERQAVESRERAVGGRRIDRALGIVLGIVLGIAVIIAFLLFGSEATIDAPSVSHGNGARPARESPPPAPSNESR